MKLLIEILLICAMACFAAAFLTYSNKDKWTARIVVTDLKGNLVKGKKPSVVCLAESPKENLICRVESVK